jgi:hypothetical protein
MSDSLVLQMAHAINNLVLSLDGHAASKTDRQKAKSEKEIARCRAEAIDLLDLYGLLTDAPAKKVAPLTTDEWERKFLELHGNDASFTFSRNEGFHLIKNDKSTYYDTMRSVLDPDNKLPPEAYAMLESFQLQARAATLMLSEAPEVKQEGKALLRVAHAGIAADKFWQREIFRALMGPGGGIDNASKEWLERRLMPWLFEAKE